MAKIDLKQKIDLPALSTQPTIHSGGQTHQTPTWHVVTFHNVAINVPNFNFEISVEVEVARIPL